MIKYYITLGLQYGASKEQIRDAYRKLVIKFHPDRNGNAEAFASVKEAYDRLTAIPLALPPHEYANVAPVILPDEDELEEIKEQNKTYFFFLCAVMMLLNIAYVDAQGDINHILLCVLSYGLAFSSALTKKWGLLALSGFILILQFIMQ